jgi:hypothetical protein
VLVFEHTTGHGGRRRAGTEQRKGTRRCQMTAVNPVMRMRSTKFVIEATPIPRGKPASMSCSRNWVGRSRSARAAGRITVASRPLFSRDRRSSPDLERCGEF